MNRLIRTITSLNNRGYAIDSAKKLHGGINSHVYQIDCKNGNRYALKLYPITTKNDLRNRYLTEKTFLEYINKCGANNVPLIVESCAKGRWNLLSWINGKKIKRLSKRDFKSIAIFIQKLNKIRDVKIGAQLDMASEGCISLGEMVEGVSLQIQDFKRLESKTQNAYDMQRWIIEQLEPKYIKDAKILLDRSKLSHWENIKEERIASPSDIGIHNMMRQKKEIIFYDFEYAGLDDLSKLTKII